MKDNEKIKAIQKLKKYHQDEMIQLLDANILTEEEQTKLYNQIDSLNFKQLDQLYSSLTKKEKVTESSIEAINAFNKDKCNKEELEHYETLGEEVLKNNQYALVTMSGGQGTRLGYNKAKGTFTVNIDPEPKSLFELLADKLKRINEQYQITIPWYIMTSDENNDEIVDFFEEHQYFNYSQKDICFFKQDNLPLMSEEKKLIISGNRKIKIAANGNGGIFNSMYKHKVLKDMKKRGIKWIFISSIDNILLKIADTSLIGLAVDQKVEIATKSILKNSPEEKVGAICKKDGKIEVVEYSEMSDSMKNAKNEDGELKFGESHVMCNLFSYKALKKLAHKKLPYHIAHKKSDYLDVHGMMIHPEEPNVYKFETFIFDAWKYFNKIAILRGKREEDFAPIKNKEGVDSPETAIKLYNNFYQGVTKV